MRPELGGSSVFVLPRWHRSKVGNELAFLPTAGGQSPERPHRLSSPFPLLNLNIFRQRALSLDLGLRRGIEGRDCIFPRVFCFGDCGGVLDIWHISEGVARV